MGSGYKPNLTGSFAEVMRRSLSPNGRLTRTEFFAISAVLQVVVAIPAMALHAALEWRASLIVDLTSSALSGVALIYVLGRRLHDVGWSAWWAALLVPVIPISIYDHWRVTLLNPDVLSGKPEPLHFYGQLVAIPLVVAFLVVWLWPGSEGPNRFGRDPRNAGQDEAEIAPVVRD